MESELDKIQKKSLEMGKTAEQSVSTIQQYPVFRSNRGA